MLSFGGCAGFHFSVIRVGGLSMENSVESPQLAVRVRGAVKGYGSHLVLKGLNMDVPYGSM